MADNVNDNENNVNDNDNKDENNTPDAKALQAKLADMEKQFNAI